MNSIFLVFLNYLDSSHKNNKLKLYIQVYYLVNKQRITTFSIFTSCFCRQSYP